jgi:hypothetical protein
LKEEHRPQFVEISFNWIDKNLDYSLENFKKIPKKEFATYLRQADWE